MKKLAVLIASVMLAATSFAYVKVCWETGGFFNDLGQEAREGAKEIVWQLVYTDNPSLTPVYEYVDGQFVSASATEILSTRTWKEGDGDTISVQDNVKPPEGSESASSLTFTTDPEAPEYGVFVEGDTIYKNVEYGRSSGGIYSAIFRTSLTGDIFYAVTEVNDRITWADGTPPPVANNVHFGGNADVTSISTLLYEAPGVPEPATMGLLGLGALSMVLRRKLRK